MGLKHLLVHVDSSPRASERLALAVALARRFEARLVGVFAEVSQLGPSVAGRRDPAAIQAAAARAREAFHARAAAAGLSDPDWWPIEATAYSEILELADACCHYVDLAILGQHERSNERVPKDLVEHVLLHSGRPVLVVPYAGHFPDAGKRVVVGWTATREAARAVNDALPLLRAAEVVRVVAFQRRAPEEGGLPAPRMDIVAHLAAHGVAAHVETVIEQADGLSVADTVLNCASDLGADLVVLGGYGETFPLPRAVGSTKDILRAMTSPVLLSH